MSYYLITVMQYLIKIIEFSILKYISLTNKKIKHLLSDNRRFSIISKISP